MLTQQYLVVGFSLQVFRVALQHVFSLQIIHFLHGVNMTIFPNLVQLRSELVKVKVYYLKMPKVGYFILNY